MANVVCPHCGSIRADAADVCPSCKQPVATTLVSSPNRETKPAASAILGEPEFLPTALMATPNREPAPAPTALVSTPTHEPAPLPTALVSTPNREPAPLPTALASSPNVEPELLATALTARANPTADVIPTIQVASPNAEPDPVPTALDMTPNVLAPLPGRASAPRRPRASTPTPRSVPLPAHPAPDAVKTVNARPQDLPEAPEGAPTGRVASAFPARPHDPRRGAAAPPLQARRASAPQTPAGSRVETREAARVHDTQDEDTADTGRVVAPYRKAKADDDTGKVAVPFRAVEAPFALDDDGEHEPVSAPSVPMSVSKKRQGATAAFEEEPELAKAVEAPFPVGQELPRKKPSLERSLIVAAGILMLFLGVSALIVLGGQPKPVLREAAIRDVSAQYQARPGHVRVGVLCNGKPMVARLFIAGVDKGDTPVEVALPTALPAGENVLELHVAGRFGEPMDAHYRYQLPLVGGRPGEAIEVELEGCLPQTFGK